MSDHPNPHFEGLSVMEHLRKTRTRGAIASAEIHGVELSGSLFAYLDALKESTILIALFYIIAFPFLHSTTLFFKSALLFSFGLIIWKMSRSAILGWERLERLHRLIEEEKWEIEHKRAQEKEELRELYAAKGFKGKTLDEIVNTLMADDNRLLRVMLEEEFGLNLESFEHPLKQSSGAGLGVLTSSALLLCSLYFFSSWVLFTLAAVLITLSAFLSAQFQRNRKIEAVIWQLSVSFFTCGATYFLMQVLV